MTQKEYTIKGSFNGTVKELREASEIQGDVEGVDDSANTAHNGNVTGGHRSANRTEYGDVEGGDDSANRTYEGNVTGGDGSVNMGSGTIQIGKESVAVRINKNGELVKIIVNTGNSDIKLLIDNKDILVDEV